MARARWFAYGLALCCLLAAVAVLVGAVYGDAGVALANASVESDTLVQRDGDGCARVIVRKATVTAVLERESVGEDTLQWWDVGVTVQASVFTPVESRVRTVGPGGRVAVRIPFTRTLEREWAPRRTREATLGVRKGSRGIARRTLSVSFRPVSENRTC